MNEAVHNSIFIRAICALWRTLATAWKQGALHRCGQTLRCAYAGSRTERLWLRWGAAPNAASHGCCAALLTRLRALWQRLGDWLALSLFYRLVCAVRDAYLRLSQHSRALRLINRLSLHQWLLLAFAWYLPLEFIIRDTLQLSALASVWEEAFIALAAGLILWRVALRQTRAIDRQTVLTGFLLLFFAVGFLLMSVVRPYPAVALPGYRIVVEYMLWYFLILHLLEDESDVRVLFSGWLLLAAFLALHGIYQYIIAVEIPSGWVSHSETGVRTRVFSLTGSPNILGSLLTLLAPLAAAGIYYCRQLWAKLAMLALVGAMMLALLFTFSRGAWLGMMLAVVIFSLLVDKRLLGLMAAAAAAVLAAVPSITARITYLFTEDYAIASSIGGRALRWETGKLLLTEHDPLLGFGLGRFGGAVAMDNQLLDETETFSYFYMDNYYLKTLVEMGYLGLAAYILLLVALVYVGVKAIQRSDLSFAALPGDPLMRAQGNRRLLAIGIFSGLCGVLLHCYFENIFEEPYMNAYFWGLAALLVYLGFFNQRQQTDC